MAPGYVLFASSAPRGAASRSRSRRSARLLNYAFLALLSLLPVVAMGQAPPGSIAAIPQAEELFRESVSAFDAGRYAEAAGEFSRVVSAFPLHRQTTAAALMEAKALYRVGSYEAAVRRFEVFLSQYPGSRYSQDARRSLALARTAVDAQAGQPLTLGVILSLSDQEASTSQAMFNGIRLAVDGHNGADRGRPIRMVFRDIEVLGADGALMSAVDAGAEIVVGALFSDQARLAAAAAERAEVVFVAPLATDTRVSEGRKFSFQANPSLPMRGRLMARFAVNGLRLRDLAVVAEADQGISEQMGNAFVAEAEQLGATVHLVKMLPNASGWSRLSNELSADTLSQVRAIYAPLAGDRANRMAGALLSGLDALIGITQPGITSRVRVLGNAEWHNLPLRTQASRYAVTYSNDYYVDPQTTLSLAFDRTYRSLTGVSPGRMGIVGYDLTTYLAGFVGSGGADQLRQRLRTAAPFEGLGIRIHFDGGQVNRSMYYHRYRDGRLDLLR